MVLDLSLASAMSFLTIMSILVIYSVLDIRERRVMNELVFVSGIVGCIVLLLTGHIISNLILHVTALVIVIPLVYILFRIGAIGGADAKSLFLVALVSPGVELEIWNPPVMEAIIGLGGELIVMLLGGYLYWRFRGKDEDVAPPLIPFLLVGYLLVQLVALV